jgi:acyl-CoA reductase-like NAD-dependent aldehyde dehydrogenase
MPIGEAVLDVFPRPGLLIGDRLVTATTGGEYEHEYPATGKPTFRVPLAGAADIDTAVQAARAAAPEWQSWTVDRRRDVMLRFAALVREHEAEISLLSVYENGTTIRQAETFVPTIADAFSYNAGWADKVGGDVITTWPVPALDYTVVEPYGVVGIIIPWNGPAPTIGMTVSPALAAGNTVVVKPSRAGPFSPLLAGQLFLEAGFPPGVVNIVPGGPEAGDALIRHPGVDKIHFMGSSAVAREVLAAALTNLTPVSLELGGKSANIIFADSDIDASAELAVSAVKLLSGQACLIGTRVLVEESVYDEVVERCKAKVEDLVVGDPASPSTHMGPLISQGACERVLGFVERARANKEGQLVTGGYRLGGDLADGYFLAPTIFADVDNGSDLAQKEIFGPLICIRPFKTEAEAVSIANDHRYGLAAYVQSNDVKRAHRMAAALEAGSIWINGFPGVPAVAVPFGGIKHSGYGRLGGWAGIQEFSRPKNVWMGL